LVAEDTGPREAGEWREFWRTRGMPELRVVLRAAWAPLAETPLGEEEAYSFRIASLLGSRASEKAIADELSRIRSDGLGVEPDPSADAAAAAAILAWFDSVRM